MENDDAENSTSLLDGMMALLLVQPSSTSALSFLRAVRSIRSSRSFSHGRQKEGLVDQLYADARNLHHILLLLETDPEIIRRNSLARILVGAEQVLSGLKDLQSADGPSSVSILEKIPEIVLNIGSATQYLNAAKLNESMNFEEELVNTEERLITIMEFMIPDDYKRSKFVMELCDRTRSMKIPSGQKGAILFIFWLFITLISYRRVKELDLHDI